MCTVGASDALEYICVRWVHLILLSIFDVGASDAPEYICVRWVHLMLLSIYVYGGCIRCS